MHAKAAACGGFIFAGQSHSADLPGSLHLPENVGSIVNVPLAAEIDGRIVAMSVDVWAWIATAFCVA